MYLHNYLINIDCLVFQSNTRLLTEIHVTKGSGNDKVSNETRDFILINITIIVIELQ